MRRAEPPFRARSYQSMIATYPDRVPHFVLALDIQGPLRRLALRRQHVERVYNTAFLQAVIRRSQQQNGKGEDKTQTENAGQ